MLAPVLNGELAELAVLATTDASILSARFLSFRFAALPVGSDDWDFRLSAAAGSLWAGRIDQAARSLQELHGARPRDPEMAAYYGIVLYLLGDHSADVAELLSRGTTIDDWRDPLADYAGWFLANHYLRTGEPGLAARELMWLSIKENRVGEASTALLEALPERYRE